MDLLTVKAFALDIDGVFTDGSILCTTDGDLLRVYDAKDGFAIRMAIMNGYPVAVITGGRSGSIRARFLTSGIPSENVYLGSRDKTADFNDFCRRFGLSPDEVMFFGDDIPDLEVICAAGIGACPCDAVAEVQEAADYVSPKPGGKGCIRDGFEKVMKARGD
jgi:3-deoxy-D-manno-octulosonate 8-phosphate phosphatase (KDO 8-P phosphatase)